MDDQNEMDTRRTAGNNNKGLELRGCNYFPTIRYHLIKYLLQNYIYMMDGMV